MGNIQSRQIELRWKDDTLGFWRPQDLQSRFPNVRPHQIIPRRGYHSIDLCPPGDGIIPWLHYRDNQGIKQGREEYYGNSAIMRTAVDTLLSKRSRACSTYLNQRFSGRNGAERPNTHSFLTYFLAFTKLSYVTGCLSQDSIQDDLLSTYYSHQRHLKSNANIDQTEKLLIIGHMLDSKQMLQDFTPKLVAAWKSGFPGRSFDQALKEASSENSLNSKDFPRALIDYLRNHYGAPEDHRRGRGGHYLDVGDPVYAPLQHFMRSPRHSPKYVSPGGKQVLSQRYVEETIARDGDYLCEALVTVPEEGDYRHRGNHGWGGEFWDVSDYTDLMFDENRRVCGFPWEYNTGGNIFGFRRH